VALVSSITPVSLIRWQLTGKKDEETRAIVAKE